MKKSKRVGNNVIFFVLLILSVLFLVPIIIVIINSFKSRIYISSQPLKLPNAETFVALENYISGVTSSDFFSAFLRSLFITVVSVILIVLFASMAAWYIVRSNSKITKGIYYMLVFSMIVPFQMVMYTMTYVTNRANLDNVFGITFVYLGFGAGLSVFMLCGFIKSIPLEIEEAAMIDGASPIQAFFTVVFPMLKPTAITVAILNTMWIWNDYLLPYLVLGSDKKTIPVAIQLAMQGAYGSTDYGGFMAMLVLAIVPIIIFYIFCQKYIIKGVVAGEFKGVFSVASITLNHIVKTFDDGVTVIPDLNLEIKDKEFVIFVGPSGCGKSTTLRMIAGLEDISSGELIIGGKTVNNIPPKDRDIAMVFQSYALYPHMTVYKNMAFALKLRKEPKDVIDKKVRQAAKILELEPYLNRKPKALSGGQRQRVALGRAMVRNPCAFLLDEPLSNLDAKLRTQMRSQIALLHKRLETTFIYVTHDQTEAMTMADRIVVMKDGIVQQFDTPSNLYNHPCNMFVAGFIGTPQMNFIDATIITCSGELCALVDDITVPLPLRMQENENVKKYVGKPIVYGIRCEDMHINSSYALENKQNEITLKADLAEMMGSEVYIYSSINDKEIIAKVRSDTNISSGDSVKLYIDTEKVHLFDPESELLICD